MVEEEQDMRDFTQSEQDGVKVSRWKDKDGHEVIAIDTIRPEEATRIRDQMMGQSRERIRQALPNDVRMQPRKFIENKISTKSFENPYDGTSPSLSKEGLYNRSDEAARLTAKKLPPNFNESDDFSLLMPVNVRKNVRE